jgi:hypothetical protein
MIAWWSDLTGANQVFYVLAAFFSAIFVWQFISALLGMAGGEMDVEVDTDVDVDMDMDMDMDMDVDADVDFDADVDVDAIEAHSMADASESVAAFRYLSLRAILAFCTLFCWAVAMYLDIGKSTTQALVYAIAWGAAGWFVVSMVVNWMRKLAESGTPRLSTAVNTTGSVYLDIPPGGVGEARVTVSGAVSMVKARAAGDIEIKAGTPIRVVRLIDNTTVEVRPVGPDGQRSEGDQ